MACKAAGKTGLLYGCWLLWRRMDTEYRIHLRVIR